MITIEEYQEMAGEIVDELPEEFFRKLNGGVIVSELRKLHADSSPVSPLYVMGEYSRSRMMGQHIMLYFGSFEFTYGHLPREQQRERLREIIVHEFRHHMEWLSGTTELEDDDKLRLADYRARFGGDRK